jgi:TonB family protein
MKRVLILVILLSGFSCRGVCARPSNYFYRVSPPNMPLKKEFADYAARPEYPLEARQRHLEGTGLFAIHIRPNGTVKTVNVLKSIGHPILDQAALAAFRRWKFYPNTVRTVKVPIRYSIHRRPPIKTNLRELGEGVQIDVSLKEG